MDPIPPPVGAEAPPRKRFEATVETGTRVERAPDEANRVGTPHPMRLDAFERAQTLAPSLPAPVFPRLSESPSLPWFRIGFPLRGLLALFRTPLRVMAAGFFLYLFAFNFSVVRGSSMAPGIHDGDRILIDQLSYLFQEVDRGDVVVLRYPLDPELDYIKRVIGLPGDEVVMAGGLVWVNGERIEETYVDQGDPFTHYHQVVEPGHYFVLGDNRLHSSDSREFGAVPEHLLRGKVDLRLWPPSRIGRVR